MEFIEFQKIVQRNYTPLEIHRSYINCVKVLITEKKQNTVNFIEIK